MALSIFKRCIEQSVRLRSLKIWGLSAALLVAAVLLSTALLSPTTAEVLKASNAADVTEQPKAPEISDVSEASQSSQTGTELLVSKPWLGDFDGMSERQVIRVLVVYNRTQYFLDGPTPRGISYETLKNFEKHINQANKKKVIKIDVVFVPVARDQLLPSLINGHGDIAVANLTITPKRSALVDFGDPMLKDVKEVLVSGPAAPAVAHLEDLAGSEIHVRRSSSYYESLLALNKTLSASGKLPVQLIAVPEALEDSDLLEMVNAGLLPQVFVDQHKARFWADIFDDIQVREDIFVGNKGQIGWAFRKDSPLLKAAVNQFVKQNKKGTLNGNMLFKRYLKSNKWARNALSESDINRFGSLTKHFKRYGDTYNIDWLMLAAQGYQESGLVQSRRSSTGAVGIMQLLPTTAADKNVNIANIDKAENNIHAGAKYLHFIRDRYFSEEPMSGQNQTLFALASYNAGPARVARLRKEAEALGLDPNRWFYNVEVVAAKRIGRETVQYVRNIYKYYVAYQRVVYHNERKDEAKQELIKAKS